VRRARLWAKHMGLKQDVVGNTIGEPIGNLKGTCWEQRKNEKILLFSPALKLKRKKIKAL